MVHTASEPADGSLIEEWAHARLAAPNISAAASAAITALIDALAVERAQHDGPFLSVVIRTQATRWEQLQDALLCLAAQTDTDFEVLLMLHEVDSENTSIVRELVETYPDSFSDRVRLCPVSGGGRTRPLSASLSEARGAYIAFFDDDDLLMANWVEAFREGVAAAPGRLIRANVATQTNHIEIWSDGSSGQRTTGVASAEYARTFNLVDNFERNHTPFMGFAFPTAFFTFWGERFDEELPVCEDWDVAMRAAKLVGVYSSEQLTAIYRQWENTQTSYTSHDREEWLEAEQRVREKFSSAPFIAPVSLVSDFIDVVARFRENEERMFKHHVSLVSSTTWRMMEPLRASLRFVRRITRR